MKATKKYMIALFKYNSYKITSKYTHCKYLTRNLQLFCLALNTKFKAYKLLLFKSIPKNFGLNNYLIITQSFLFLCLQLLSLLPLKISKHLVCTKDTVPKSKLRTIVSKVATMMEIMEIVVSTKWQQLQRRPTENITTMTIISVSYPQNRPNSDISDMNRTQDIPSQHKIKLSRYRIRNQELNNMKVQSCCNNSCIVLMMYFMYMFVKKRCMQQIMGCKEEEIFENMKEQQILEQLFYRGSFIHVHYISKLHVTVDVEENRRHYAKIEDVKANCSPESTIPLFLIFLPRPFSLHTVLLTFASTRYCQKKGCLILQTNHMNRFKTKPIPAIDPKMIIMNTVSCESLSMRKGTTLLRREGTWVKSRQQIPSATSFPYSICCRVYCCEYSDDTQSITLRLFVQSQGDIYSITQNYLLFLDKDSIFQNHLQMNSGTIKQKQQLK